MGHNPQTEKPSGAPSAKKTGRKARVAAGIAAIIVVVAVAGFWVWHEQPSFCGAICHTPMDPYLETYDQEPNAAGVDKWGNAVDSTNSMLAVAHRATGEDCLSCHIPTLSEQISEGVAWATGDYEVVENEAYGVVLTEKSLKDLTAASGADPESFCMNEACHANPDGSAMEHEDLMALTSSYEFNPHANEHGNVTCSDCHKAHRASVMYCTKCHNEAEVPEGWLTTVEADQLSK